MTSTAKGYTEGTWKGLEHFQCERCAYATAGKGALRDMKIHVASHLGLPDDVIHVPEDEPDAAVLDFASDEAAEAFVAEPEGRQRAVALALMDREPSGANGYTVDDVRRAAASVTTEEG